MSSIVVDRTRIRYEDDETVIVHSKCDNDDILVSKLSKDETDSLISFNGITFYYNSDEIQLTSELFNYLKKASEFEQRYGENDSFCIVADPSQGIFYY
ncbi:hypothetical protein [Rummeliibacillus suwonensis]|uniref:hypothetical protein n=1 Tax=Rummeliibacillus suwonensis TaxID=1306154 RepID=UPI0011B5B7E4|nr:hypothetical protein [Rummeliibacillus suwonensis]